MFFVSKVNLCCVSCHMKVCHLKRSFCLWSFTSENRIYLWKGHLGCVGEYHKQKGKLSLWGDGGVLQKGWAENGGDTSHPCVHAKGHPFWEEPGDSCSQRLPVVQVSALQLQLCNKCASVAWSRWEKRRRVWKTVFCVGASSFSVV